MDEFLYPIWEQLQRVACMDEVEMHSPDLNPPQGELVPVDTIIPVASTEGGFNFSRRMNCKEFMRQLIRFFVTRQIQCLPPDYLDSSPHKDGARQKDFQVFR